MEYIQGHLCIQVSSLLDAVLISRIPDYGSGYNSNDQRVNTLAVFQEYSSLPFSDVLTKLNLTIRELPTSTIFGVPTKNTKEIRVIRSGPNTYLCINSGDPGRFSFFY